MALDAGPFVRTRTRGSPSWPTARRKAGYVCADRSDWTRETTCRRGGPYVLAGTEALSSAARLQSRASPSASCSSRARCSRAHTPASCQSRRRRQHVMPEQPSWRGSNSHAVPERSTNRMPASALRSSHRGRPPFGLGGSGGSRGAMADQRASVTRGSFITPERAQTSFVRCSKPLARQGRPEIARLRYGADRACPKIVGSTPSRTGAPR